MGYANSARVAYQCTLHKGSICKHLAKLTIVVFMLSASDPVCFFLVANVACALYCMPLVSMR